MKAIYSLEDMYWDVDELSNYVWSKDMDENSKGKLHELIVTVSDTVENVSDKLSFIEEEVIDIRDTLHHIVHETDKGVSRVVAKELLSKANKIFTKL